jgi:hypothetical protein
MPYTLTVSSGTEGPGLKCLTEIPAAHFAVVSESASVLGR